MQLSDDQQAAVLRAVDQRLTAAGISTHLWAYDHNWDGASDALAVLNQVKDVPRVQGAAFHCYGGSPESVAQIIAAGWRVYDTECSPTASSTPSATFSDTLRWQTDNLVVRAFRSGAETLMLWNLALDANGGPQFGYCGNSCRGVVQIANGSVTHGAAWDVLGHVSKFVQVGARVIASSGSTGGVENVAFLNPDGSKVMIALNTGTALAPFSVTEGTKTFDYTLPAGAVATFVWN
jgi:glucosylceramidase